MASNAYEYSFRELTIDTLPDFEKLLETHPAPGAYPCWCMYNHRARSLLRVRKMGASAERKPTNRQEKRTLVKQGRSHGIIVYAKGEPIGWCQYGTKEELPRIESNAIYRKIAPTTSDKLWRITCFVTSRQYRKRGVASAALTATLEAIKKNGGGIVEAYPIVRWGAYAEYRGTASMFKKHGFMIVGRLGRSNVLMRKTIKN